jgi:ribosomal protein S27AE
MKIITFGEKMSADITYPVCPRCGGFIPNNDTPGSYSGALSRLDNKTEICSDCGVDESIENYYDGQIMNWINPGK